MHNAPNMRMVPTVTGQNSLLPVGWPATHALRRALVRLPATTSWHCVVWQGAVCCDISLL